MRGVVGQGLGLLAFPRMRREGGARTDALSIQSMTRTQWETTLFMSR